MRNRVLAPALLVLTGGAAATALAHLDNLPAYIVIAPGYLVQAALFEAHRALGGFGYRATMVGVSAVFWTAFLLGAVAGMRLLERLVRRPTSHG